MLLSSIETPILLCQFRHNMVIAKTGGVIIAPDPLACLNEATRRNFGLVIISFTDMRVGVRNTVLELCRCLNTHPITKKTPILVSVESQHRDMAVRLIDAGVRFMEVRQSGAPIDPACLLRLVNLDDPSVSINLIMSRLCPFIRYSPIDDHCELTTCKAYRNKMVLGGRRLHEVCETGTHAYCDHFLHPRVNS